MGSGGLEFEAAADDAGAGWPGGWCDLGAVGVDGIPACVVESCPREKFRRVMVDGVFTKPILFSVQKHANVLVRIAGAFAIIRDRMPRKAAGCECVHGCVSVGG